MRNGLVSITAILTLLCTLTAATAGPKAGEPIVKSDVVFEEVNGVVAVEAEHFFKQTLNNVRSWCLFSPAGQPKLTPDADPPHLDGASGGAYLEILPDTRRNHGEKLITGENFMNNPGKMAVLHYKVHFNTPGKYYVWARIFSTGTEDNGMHVGSDGTWPASGQRMQWTGKQKWVWGSKQRTAKQHGGEKHKLFLDVDKPGEHVISFSMREDGTEFDKWMMIKEKKESMSGVGPATCLKRGTLPKTFPVVKAPAVSAAPRSAAKPAPGKLPTGATILDAKSFALQGSNYYLDGGKWLAVDPAKHKSAKATAKTSLAAGTYHVTLYAVGENDGESRYEVLVGGKSLGSFVCPLAGSTTAEGPKYTKTWPSVSIGKNANVEVRSQIASKNGQDHSRARIARLAFVPSSSKNAGVLLSAAKASAAPPAASAHRKGAKPPVLAVSTTPLVLPRKPHGKGAVTVGGDLKQWHKVTLTVDGPYAHELDNAPNPFLDYRMLVLFQHASGSPRYVVPGYFAADGKASDTSAESGTTWRAHLSPDKVGKWSYRVSFVKGKQVAVSNAAGTRAPGFDGKSGSFEVKANDSSGRDMRARGRLQYVGRRHLRFAGSGEYFLKCGADAPENFLAYADFDGDFKKDGHKDDLIKTWQPHVKDWRSGDPTWQNGKGKGIIGAINYLASEGLNSFSFLPFNVGGDDRNVFPYVAYNDWTHLDCSRLDQWEIVFSHGERMGMYLHFKTMETENEMFLDGGDLGPQRKLYYRELIARFAHHMALNWNLGEEINSASHEQKVAWGNYFHAVDPYKHNIVIHNMGEPHYDLLGSASALTGFSLQTSKPDFRDVHHRTLDYINRSIAAGKPWVVACDEPGDAQHSLRPDNDAGASHTDARKNALWGNIMAGGAGLEFYFGYKHAHSDLTCQDFRSRDGFWDYCRYALEFFDKQEIPFWEMKNADGKVSGADAYCLQKPNALYLVYVKNGGTAMLDMSGARGAFKVQWFNPRTGGSLATGSTGAVTGGSKQSLGLPPRDKDQDWLAVVSR